jgi:hypothetical protein
MLMIARQMAIVISAQFDRMSTNAASTNDTARSYRPPFVILSDLMPLFGAIRRSPDLETTCLAFGASRARNARDKQRSAIALIS